jgi:hypothetical protein
MVNNDLRNTGVAVGYSEDDDVGTVLKKTTGRGKVGPMQHEFRRGNEAQFH